MARFKPYWVLCFAAYIIILALVALLNLSFKWIDVVEWVLLGLGGIFLLLRI